jgi:hypothetical protein
MECQKCGCSSIIIDWDYDLKVIEVFEGEECLGKIFPQSVPDSKSCVKELESGVCPVCEGWGDGLGNICNLDGWGEQGEVKRNQNYRTRPFYPRCSNCKHFKSEFFQPLILDEKMFNREKKPHCRLGGFPVKETALCDKHSFVF